MGIYIGGTKISGREKGEEKEEKRRERREKRERKERTGRKEREELSILRWPLALKTLSGSVPGMCGSK